MALLHLESLPRRTTKGTIVRLLTQVGEIERRRIGAIELRGREATVEVPDKWASRLGKALDASRARDAARRARELARQEQERLRRAEQEAERARQAQARARAEQAEQASISALQRGTVGVSGDLRMCRQCRCGPNADRKTWGLIRPRLRHGGQHRPTAGTQ